MEKLRHKGMANSKPSKVTGEGGDPANLTSNSMLILLWYTSPYVVKFYFKSTYNCIYLKIFIENPVQCGRKDTHRV